MEEEIEKLRKLKKEQADFLEKHKGDPSLGMCYSTLWDVQDDIRSRIDAALKGFFKKI